MAEQAGSSTASGKMGVVADHSCLGGDGRRRSDTPSTDRSGGYARRRATGDGVQHLTSGQSPVDTKTLRHPLGQRRRGIRWAEEMGFEVATAAPWCMPQRCGLHHTGLPGKGEAVDGQSRGYRKVGDPQPLRAAMLHELGRKPVSRCRLSAPIR